MSICDLFVRADGLFQTSFGCHPQAMWKPLGAYFKGASSNMFRELAGNAMCVPTVGMICLWVLSHSQRTLPPDPTSDAPFRSRSDLANSDDGQ